MSDPIEVPLPSGSEGDRSEVNVSTSDNSISTIASHGTSEEPTLQQVLERVCKTTRFPELEKFLALKDLTSPEGFAVTEQEDFHEMVPQFGRVTVRKLMILANYCKVSDKFPPLDMSITQVQRSLKASDDWEELSPIPPSPERVPGGSPNQSEGSPPTYSKQEVLIAKESGVSLVKLSKFSGEPQDWGAWYTAARGDLGNNRWLHVAEKPLDEPLETEREKEINTSLFWQLRRACIDGSQSSEITALDPPKGAQFARGREAWQALVDKCDTKL